MVYVCYAIFDHKWLVPHHTELLSPQSCIQCKKNNFKNISNWWLSSVSDISLIRMTSTTPSYWYCSTDELIPRVQLQMCSAMVVIMDLLLDMFQLCFGYIFYGPAYEPMHNTHNTVQRRATIWAYWMHTAVHSCVKA